MVVPGGGGGRLVESCVAACRAHGGAGSAVLALDANPLAVTMLRARFAATDVAVTVAEAFTLLPGCDAASLPTGCAPFAGSCHIAVAELLGSFGCNEFLPELMTTIAQLFLLPDGRGGSGSASSSGSSGPVRTALIPHSWTTWVRPVHCPSVRRYLSILKKPLDAAYVVGFPPDAVALGPATELFSAACDDGMAGDRTHSGVVSVEASAQPPPHSELARVEAEADKQGAALKRRRTDAAAAGVGAGAGGLECDGWLGYFTAELWNGLCIDSRHCSRGWNSFHWEAFFFPLPAAVTLPSLQPAGSGIGRPKLRLELKRMCIAEPQADGDEGPPAQRLWYSWRSGLDCEVEDGGAGVAMDRWQNEGGAVQSLRLVRAEGRGRAPPLDTPTTDPDT